MAVAKLKSSPLYSALGSTCQHTEDRVPYWITINLMGMGKYGYSGKSLALVAPARGPERSGNGPPELSTAMDWFPAGADPAPTTRWP